MNASKSDYIYPDLNGHKVLYKGKRFWIFEISKEFPFRGYEEFCDVIVYDKKDGAEMAGAKKTTSGFIGSLIGPRESIEVSGSSPIELLNLPSIIGDSMKSILPVTFRLHHHVLEKE